MPRPALDLVRTLSLGVSASRLISVISEALADDQLSSREVLKVGTNLALILRDLGVDLPETIDEAIESNKPDALLQSLIDLLSNLKVKIRK